VLQSPLGLPVLRLIPFTCMPSLLPRQVRWKLVRSYIPIVFGLPRISGGSAPATPFSRPAQRSPCYGLQICQVALATFYTRGFSSFVASTAAPIATGWSEPAPGRDFHPLWISAFSRRTEKCGLGNFSNAKSVGAGVYECKIDFGPGYRVYFGKEGEQIVILLGGGTKRRQQNDIKLALERWEDYKLRKKQQEEKGGK